MANGSGQEEGHEAGVKLLDCIKITKDIRGGTLLKYLF